jgi:hypothetical protein
MQMLKVPSHFPGFASGFAAALSALIFSGVGLSSPVPALADCPNAAFRIGPSGQLPDCRAYEIVTPPDSNGRAFRDPTGFSLHFDEFPMELDSPVGDSFIFDTSRSPLKTPPGANGRIEGDVYEAKRSDAGWQTVRHVTPTGAETVIPMPGGISADHGYNFVFVPVKLSGLPFNGSLGREGDGDFLGDPTGSYELTGVGSLGVERLAQGRYISPGGAHVIFSTGRTAEESGWCYLIDVDPKLTCSAVRLEPEAPPTGTGAIYDRTADGPTHVVSLLPGNKTPGAGENAIYQGVSSDGSSVAFKVGDTLYVRADNGSPGANTEEVANSGATFAGISAEGAYLFYVVGGNIHRFSTESGKDEQLNSSGDAEMVNVSADGSHVYFISPSQLVGAEGMPSEPNLYAWSDGALTYVATVAESDTTGSPALTNWISQVAGPAPNGFVIGPGNDSSRTTPDGSVIVFESRAQLTPLHDNAGHEAIYRYETLDDSLTCVSCGAVGSPATADARLQPPAERELEPRTVVHNLTADGGRVFFETSEPLVEGDLDSVNDVYEWQATEGIAPLALISSGNATAFAQTPGVSPEPNILMGVSADGSDVFFRSLEPLVPGAPEGGAMAIYDARVGGGFPIPSPAPACLGLDTCRAASDAAPALERAGSQSLAGTGNVKPRKHRRCHRKHKRREQKQRRCHHRKAGVAK